MRAPAHKHAVCAACVLTNDTDQLLCDVVVAEQLLLQVQQVC